MFDESQEKKYKTKLRNKYIMTSSKEINAKGINIKDEILNVLNEEGIDIEHDGTKYLASLIALLFHERKLYQTLHDRKNYQDYWELDNEKNEHYQMLGTRSSNALKEIKNVITESDKNQETLVSLIYRITDNLTQQYDETEEMIGYQKLLENKSRK